MQPNRRRSRFDIPQPKYKAQMREIFVQNEPVQEIPPNQPGPIMRNIWREEEIQRAREQIERNRQRSQTIEQLIAEDRQMKQNTFINQGILPQTNSLNIPRQGILRNSTSTSSWSHNVDQAPIQGPSISMRRNHSNGNNTSYNASTSSSFPLVDYSSDEGDDVKRRNRQNTNKQDEDHEGLEDLGVMKELKKVLAAVSERSIFSSGDTERDKSRQEPKFRQMGSQSSQYENIKWDIDEEISSRPNSKLKIQAPRIKFQIQPAKEETLKSKLSSIKQPQPPKVENKLIQQSSTILNRIRQNKWDAYESKKTTEVQKLIEENKHSSFEFKKYSSDEYKLINKNKSKLYQQDATILGSQPTLTKPISSLNYPTNQLQNSVPGNYNQSFQFQSNFLPNQVPSLDLKSNFYLNPTQQFRPQGNFLANQIHSFNSQSSHYPNELQQLQLQSQQYANQMQSYAYNNPEFNHSNVHQVGWNARESAFPSLSHQTQFNYSQRNFDEPNRWDSQRSAYFENDKMEKMDYPNQPEKTESGSKRSAKRNKRISNNSKYSEECQVKPISNKGFVDFQTFTQKESSALVKQQKNLSKANSNNQLSKKETPSDRKVISITTSVKAETSTKAADKKETCTTNTNKQETSSSKNKVQSNKPSSYYQQKYTFDTKSQSASQSKQQSSKSEEHHQSNNKNSSSNSKKNDSSESKSLKEQQSNPTQKTSNTNVQKVNVSQKPIKSILKNSSKFQEGEEAKSTAAESKLPPSNDKDLKSSQTNNSNSRTPAKSAVQEKSPEIKSSSQNKTSEKGKSAETKFSTAPIKSTTQGKSTISASTSQSKPSTNDKSAESKLSVSSPVKSTTQGKSTTSASTSQSKSGTNDKSVESKFSASLVKSTTQEKSTISAFTSQSKPSTNDKSAESKLSASPVKTITKNKVAETKSMPSIKSSTNNKVVETKSMPSIKSSTNNKVVETKSNISNEVKAIDKDAGKVTKTFDENKFKAIYKLKLCRVVIERLDITNLKPAQGVAKINNPEILSVKTKSQETNKNLSKKDEIELVDLASTDTGSSITISPKKATIKLNLKSKVLKTPNSAVSDKTKSTANKTSTRTKLEVVEPKLGERNQETKSSTVGESTGNKSAQAKYKPIVWDLPKKGAQTVPSQSSEENNSVKRRLEPVKLENDDSSSAKKFKDDTQPKVNLESERSANAALSTSEKSSPAPQRSREEKSAAEKDEEKIAEDDPRKYKLQGAIFGNLKPIPTDPNLDPPPHVCYKCWKLGHNHNKCLNPKYRKYCYNCGRLYVNMYTCPRCKEEHERYLERKKQAKMQESFKLRDRLGDYVDDAKPTSSLKNRLGDFVDDKEQQQQLVQKFKDRLGDYIDDDLNLRGKVNVNHPAYREHMERSNYQPNSAPQPYNQQRNRNSFPGNQYNKPGNSLQPQPQTSRSRSPIRRNRAPNQAPSRVDTRDLEWSIKEIGPGFVTDLLDLLDNLRDRSPETRNTFLKIALDEFKSKKESRLFRN